ncbi:MAG: NUDIX hydrolase [Anaeroplasmataceae bacterium]|nr:NUDIX hydrolase [Anaeroplasmataceae bacterium]
METFLNRQTIYNGRILKLELDQVKCDNGVIAYREIIRHSGGAGILCISEDQKVLLIKQFRYAYNEEIYEIPAGKLEKGEDPLDSAKREFEEETGHIAEEIKYLTTIYPTCGYTDEKIYLYLVTKFKVSKPHFDEDEMIESVWIDFKDVLDMIHKGTIKDAKTICAIQSYLLMRNCE